MKKASNRKFSNAAEQSCYCVAPGTLDEWKLGTGSSIFCLPVYFKDVEISCYLEVGHISVFLRLVLPVLIGNSIFSKLTWQSHILASNPPFNWSSTSMLC